MAEAYLVITPGERRWETVRTEATRLAREGGGVSEPKSIPTDKKSLIPFLNEIEKDAAAHAAGAPLIRQDERPQIEMVAEDATTTAEGSRKNPMVPTTAEAQAMRVRMGQCPGCARTDKAAAWFASHADVEDLLRVIKEAPPETFVTLFDAFLERSKELKPPTSADTTP